MLEARRFTHISARAFARHLTFIAICFFTFSTVATNAAETVSSARQTRSDFSQRSSFFANYSSVFDRILSSTDADVLDDPVPVSLPHRSAKVDSNFSIPVTVGDTTGKGIRAFQFDLIYDPDVIVPQASPIDSAGTISQGMGVSVNNTVPGVLRVVFFSGTHLTGAGTLFKFNFTATGAEGENSPLTWQDFMFNEGVPVAAVTNGSVVLVTDHTITVTQTSNGTIQPGTTEVPYGTNQEFTITPAPNHHIVAVVVDGLSVGAVSTYTFTNVTADHTLTATFAINTYPITATSGPNGTVTPAGVTNVTYNGTQVYTITPGPNYLIDDVLVDGASVGAVSSYTFPNVTAPHTISATFKIKRFALNVLKPGNGTGTVTSSPAGIDCGVDCDEIYDIGTQVTLTAAPAIGTSFTGWSGACTGTETCIVTMDAAKTVTATFVRQTYVLTVIKPGNGNGTVTSDPIGIDCGTDCTETYNHGTVVTLTAAPAAGTNFTGWSGACSGTGTCVVTMTEARAVTATFTLQTFNLTVTKPGNGAGTVTSSPGGIDCGSDCTEAYNIGTVVTLTAAPATGSNFTGWSGACSGTGSCVVTMTEARAVTATFTLQTFNLNVTKPGTGAGTVTSVPAGIDCGSDCAETYNYGAVVTMTAAPGTGSDFTGWTGGGCSGTGTCVVTVTAATAVAATFTLRTFSLTVNRVGNGTGTVASTPAGIDCGSDCFDIYGFGVQVTLTATPSPNSNFTGWSGGGCSGTGTCVVTMSAATTVMATFAIKTFALNVTLAGNGTGSVTSSPTGINCGTDCAKTYDFGTVVTLTAAPNANSNFVGWSGGCTGTGTCQLTMNAAASVTATFTIKTFNLTVNKTGTGQGTITSSPPGIDCGTDCLETYNIATVVTLTAAPAPGNTFDGWSGGGCTGTGTCVVTMNAAATVTASFTRIVQTLTVTVTGNGFGKVTSNPFGINCGSNCSASYPTGSEVELHAFPEFGTTFTGWSGGGCTGTGVCLVTLNAAVGVTANFVVQSFPLNVIKAGTGASISSVTSVPAGINCGSDCEETLNFGSSVALTATPGPNVTFNGWSGGGCSGTGTCFVTISGVTNVTATFTILTFGLNVTKSSNGAGVVTSVPAGIDCGDDCAEAFNIGTVVTLTAAPDPGSNFIGWSGGVCSGTGTCTVTMNQAALVNAVFTLQVYELAVNKDGNGSGTVTSAADGINCGVNCSAPYNYGTIVTLTASPGADSNFTGWSGAGCTGMGNCVVTITQAATVTATFVLKQFTLNVDKASNGTGTITSSPPGIDCGGDCTEIYDFGTEVTLTAVPGSGSSFGGWSGGCSGTGSCVVTITAATSVTAAFNTFPTIQLSSTVYKGNESKMALVALTRTGDLTIPSTVTLSTSPGTASGSTDCNSLGADYIEISQPVNFAPSEAVQSVPVSLCPDTNIDPFETIDVLASAPVNANLGPQNLGSITINDTANQFLGGQDGIFLFSNTNGEPYPAIINTANAPTGTARVRVTLYDVWHFLPNNIRALLVSPTGIKYMLMGATGGSNPIAPNAPVTITFADFQAQILPVEGPIATGAYKPTTCMSPIPDFLSPAPSGQYIEPGCALLSGPILGDAYSGQNQNGGWELYLMDVGTGVPFTLAGSVSGGWGLELVATPKVEISGKVLTPSRLGLRNAVVSLTDSSGGRRTISTSSLGFFTFDNVEAGRTYTITVSSRRYRFDPLALQVTDNVQNLELVGLE